LTERNNDKRRGVITVSLWFSVCVTIKLIRRLHFQPSSAEYYCDFIAGLCLNPGLEGIFSSTELAGMLRDSNSWTSTGLCNLENVTGHYTQVKRCLSLQWMPAVGITDGTPRCVVTGAIFAPFAVA